MSDAERLGVEIFVKGFKKFASQMRQVDALLDKTEGSFKGAGRGADKYSDDLNKAEKSTKGLTGESKEAAVAIGREGEAMEAAASDADKLADKTKKAGDEAEKAGGKTKKAGDKAKTFGEKVKVATSAMAGFAATAAIVTGVAKKAFDFAEEGAAILQTSESFDILLASIGAAPDLLNQLQEAAAGTISDMQLMSSVSTLLAGAEDELAVSLAEATPQLLEIARAAQKLNPSLGDTTFLFESIATGIKRGSPQVLDNLGLIIKLGDANENYAKQLGITVDELSATDRSIALLNETLGAGEILMDQVGGNVDSATDSFARFKVKLKQNMADPIKTFLATGLTPWLDLMTGEVVEAIDKNIKALDEYEGSMADVAKAVQTGIFLSNLADFDMERGLIGVLDDSLNEVFTTLLEGSETWDEFLQAVNNTKGPLLKAALGLSDFDEESFNAFKSTKELTAASAEYVAQAIRAGEVSTQAAGAADELSASHGVLGKVFRIAGESAEYAERAVLSNVEAHTKLVEKAKAAIEKERLLGKQMEDLADIKAAKLREKLAHVNEQLVIAQAEMGGYFSDALAAGEATGTLTMRLFEASQKAGVGAKELGLLALATGEFTEAEIKSALETAAMQAKIEELAKSLAEGKMGIPEALTELEVFKNTLKAIPREIVTKVKIQRPFDAPPEHYQFGGPTFPGERIMVGEGGPEMIISPGGSVVPNQRSFTDARQFNLTTNTTESASTLAATFQGMDFSSR